ncbi:MAG TPA: VOC family protein [Bacillales bacterium]|nr:VOC family protein [Bacillales bacterium]
MNFLSLNEIYLPVTDVETTAKWYRDKFNLSRSWEGKVAGSRAVELAFSNTAFTLVESDCVNHYSHIPFNLQTSVIKEIHASIKQNGVTVTDLIDEGDLYCTDFYDPEGNRIGLVFEKSGGSPEEHIEVGGAFLTIRDLDKSVQWYHDKLGFEFHFFEATGGAGYIGPMAPEYHPSTTIHYAGVLNKYFESEHSRIALVETPEFTPLVHKPFNILSLNLEEDYEILRSRDVHLTPISDGRFTFQDLDDNEIEIVG